MNNDNKWGALSMKDRAFLIRQAVKNGITDIGSIRDTWEHRFDGKSNNSTGNYIETDVNHSRDGSWIERLAYNIGSTPRVKDSGKATLLDGDILVGIMNTMVGRQPYDYPDLKAFLGHPEDVGYKKTDDDTGPQFTDALHNYPKGSIQTYKGTINPYNEYVVIDDDYNKFVDMAQRGEIFYSNVDMESFGLRSDNYRDDVGNYPIQFVMEDGELYANAADLYDFNVSNWQGRLLTKYGNPYIRRQNKIPVRKIALPEGLVDIPFISRDSIDGIPVTDEMRRARNMHRIVKKNAPHLFSGEESDDSGIWNSFVNWLRSRSRPVSSEQQASQTWPTSYEELDGKVKKIVQDVATKYNYTYDDIEDLYNSGKMNAPLSAVYQYAPSGRVRDNDVAATKEASEDLEKKMNIYMYNSYPKSHGQASPNMTYAIPYIESEEIRVPGVGRTTKNALDSLAKYAAKVKIPLYEAVGLAAQETALGAIPVYNYKAIPKNATEEEKQKVRDYNRALGNSSYFRNYGVIPAEHLVRDFRYNYYPIDRSIPPLEHAFTYWKEGNYNRGDKNHTRDVRVKGRKVMSSEIMQEWAKHSKYAQKALKNGLD